MRRIFILLTIGGILFSGLTFSCAQEEDAKQILVLRKAQERQNTVVAVEAYLINDILEVTVIASMYATRPRIYNLILVGPRLGRLSPKEKESLYPKAEDKEMDFPTEDMQGRLIRFSKKIKEKKVKGTLTKELFKFKIPADRIIPNKRYELRIEVESMQRPGQPERFRFELKNLPELISK